MRNEHLARCTSAATFGALTAGNRPCVLEVSPQSPTKDADSLHNGPRHVFPQRRANNKAKASSSHPEHAGNMTTLRATRFCAVTVRGQDANRHWRPCFRRNAASCARYDGQHELFLPALPRDSDGSSGVGFPTIVCMYCTQLLPQISAVQ